MIEFMSETVAAKLKVALTLFDKQQFGRLVVIDPA